MSNSKTKNSENNENLCPLQRKRPKSTPHSHSKVGKFESGSSPSSSISLDLLEEMGISVLDSESSSSSVVSAVTLTTAMSGDENANEATPNLDATKFNHNQRISAYRAVDCSLDITLDNASPSYMGETTKSAQTTIKMTTVLENNNNNNNNASSNRNNSNDNDLFNYQKLYQQQQQQQQAQRKIHKKTAILGMGAGNLTSAVNTPTSPHGSLIQSPGKLATRSPLSVVTCSYYNNTNTVSTYVESAATISSSTPHSSNVSLYQHGLSPSSLPSTSKQALKMQQQRLFLQQQQQEPQKQQQQAQDTNFFLYRLNEAEKSENAINHFEKLSDEIILHIFKWLPKKALLRCGIVCQRFSRCAADESLWSRLDLGGRTLRPGVIEDVMKRGVVVCRLSQAEINHPVFNMCFLENEPSYESKIQYLDLSMASITKPSLKLLFSRCRQLKKLSLEHVSLNDDICNEIAKNTGLEALNLAMCSGIEAWSVRTMFSALTNLTSLNISWTNLTVDAVSSFVTHITPNLLRLNIAGCRKTMFDLHLSALAKRCPQLLELDVSDCIALTGNSIEIICRFKMLEYLSLSRCYLIPASHYMDLSNLPTLTYLDVFGMLSEPALEMLQQGFPTLGINKFIHSSVARPTVGTRRTAIWGLRTRD